MRLCTVCNTTKVTDRNVCTSCMRRSFGPCLKCGNVSHNKHQYCRKHWKMGFADGSLTKEMFQEPEKICIECDEVINKKDGYGAKGMCQKCYKRSHDRSKAKPNKRFNAKPTQKAQVQCPECKGFVVRLKTKKANCCSTCFHKRNMNDPDYAARMAKYNADAVAKRQSIYEKVDPSKEIEQMGENLKISVNITDLAERAGLQASHIRNYLASLEKDGQIEKFQVDPKTLLATIWVNRSVEFELFANLQLKPRGVEDYE